MSSCCIRIGRVSEVQRRQMTTVLDANVHNIALEGSFDDAQNIVKALFADAAFAARTQLTAVNSINFARIVAQCVYYFTAAAALGRQGSRANFVVPTGNFGDVFAGEAAARMGLADRSAGRRDQLERHPGARADNGRLQRRARAADAVPVDGHPGRQQFRTRPVRGREPRWAFGLNGDAGVRRDTRRSRSRQPVLAELAAPLSRRERQR